MASPNASTPVPTVPSVQQESTLEEDYFAELLLDDDDAEYDFDLAPKKKSKEERIEEAVNASKREYRFDHGRTDLWWSLGRDQHPHHFDRDRNPPDKVWPDVVDVKIIEMNIAQLYYLKRYTESFNLGLRLLCPTIYSHFSAADVPKESIAYDPDLPLDWDKCPREVADAMLRVAVKTRAEGWCSTIADGTRRTWTQPSQGVLAEVASKAYTVEGRYRDALLAITWAILDRSLLRPFQTQLLDLLTRWEQAALHSDVTGSLKSTLKEMRNAMEHCVRTTQWRDQPLFDDKEPGSSVDPPRDADVLGDSPYITTEPAFLDRIHRDLDMTDSKEIELVAKSWKRVVGCLTARRRGGVNLDEDEDGVQGGRSVRTL